jgi:hypothetical protein
MNTLTFTMREILKPITNPEMEKNIFSTMHARKYQKSQGKSIKNLETHSNKDGSGLEH